ncbi:MAG: 16S rRNA (guanine966-N2)-methyltransferase [Candidatus Marivariicella framensis]|jgi:16S rRNA (guanine966-N2)-methyltransferase|tara:strand:- start:1014 stop:1547 length:534 start_codon:yes stop_codon:yes gene_type:complete
MRIISGIHKGRIINPPKNLSVRPTTDRSKEALFNILNNLYRWEDISVLDLFSGTGSVSFEFASRGVKTITSVDQNEKCINFINQVSNDLDLNILSVKKKVLDFLNFNSRNFSIVFLDPPYIFDIKEYEKIILILISKNWIDDGLIIVEHFSKVKLNKILGFKETRKYGNNSFSFFKK